MGGSGNVEIQGMKLNRWFGKGRGAWVCDVWCGMLVWCGVVWCDGGIMSCGMEWCAVKTAQASVVTG